MVAGKQTRKPASLRSTVFTFTLAAASELRLITGIRTGTQRLRRRSLFIHTRAARRLDFARSLVTGRIEHKMSADLKHGLQPKGWFKDRNRDRLLVAGGRTCATRFRWPAAAMFTPVLD
jgi:hypothetical protein